MELSEVISIHNALVDTLEQIPLVWLLICLGSYCQGILRATGERKHIYKLDC